MTTALAEAAEATQTLLAADDRIGRYVAQVKISERRKSLGLSMKPGDAGVTVHLSVRDAAQPGAVLKALRGNSHLLAAMMTKARENAPDTPVKELVGGTGFLWLGRSIRLRLVDSAPVPLELTDWNGVGKWFFLDRSAVAQGAKPLIDWYVREGTQWLRTDPEALYLWQRIAGTATAPSVRAVDIGGKRWGAYRSDRHEVRVAWQTFQLPPSLIRHVLAHELVHASRPGGKPHGPQFWRAFERALPGARQQSRELDKQGRTAWMGDVA